MSRQMPTVLIVAVWPLTVICALFIGGFLKSYMSKKGENLATHEDIDRLVAQVRAVTTTTEEIKANILGDIWDRQKRWEVKREVLFEALRRVAAVDDLLKDLNNILQTETKNPELINLAWTQTSNDANAKWFDGITALEESELLVETTCAKETADSISDYHHLMVTCGAKINKNDVEIYRSSRGEINRLRTSIRNAVRKELGIDAKN